MFATHRTIVMMKVMSDIIAVISSKLGKSNTREVLFMIAHIRVISDVINVSLVGKRHLIS
jgi:hypothetical protein